MRINRFLEYAKDSQKCPPSELKSLIEENIKQIANCVNASRQNGVGLLSLNLRTLRFSKKDTGYAASYTPLFVARILRWDEMSDEGANVKDFFDFLAASLPDLGDLKIGENTESLSSHVFKSYSILDLGLEDLQGIYPYRSIDKDKVKAARRSLDALACASALYLKIPSFDIFSLSNYKLTAVESAFELLKFKRYAPLREMMQIKATNLAKERMTEKLGSIMGPDFFGVCLRMKEEELKEFCLKQEKVFKHENPYHLYITLLQDERFSSIHIPLLSKILRRKNINETGPQFDDWTHGEYAKSAIDHVLKQIKTLKKEPQAETLIFEYLLKLDRLNSLDLYKPFEILEGFLYRRFDAPENKNPAPLPIKNIGNSDVLNFLKNVFLDVEDPRALDVKSKEGKSVLLKASLFLWDSAQKYKNIREEKLEEWVSSYPEYKSFPEIEKVISGYLK